MSLFVPARTRDSVVGDLLEEYRDTQVPSRGESGADVWYCRQALAFVWTASAPAGFAVAGTLTVRMLTDVLAPSAQLSGRAWITTLLGMGIRVGPVSGRPDAWRAVVMVAATVV